MIELKTRALRGPRAAAALAALLLAGLIAGCATAPGATEDAVVERAKARWAAVIAGDYETSYPFYTPGYRSTTSLIDYAVEMRTRRVTWTTAEYRSHDCEENRCTVAFSIGYRVHSPVPGLTTWNGQSAVEDTWVRTGGQWWYLPPQD